MNAPADRADPGLLRKVGADCWVNLPGLMGANLLFLLWCAPSVALLLLSFPRLAAGLAVLTVGPALVGLLRYAANVVRERPAGVWRDSLRGMRSGYRAGVVAGLVVVAAVTAHRLALAQAVTAQMAAGATAVWAAELALLLVLALTGAHTLSLIGLYQQPLREAFRNGVLLAVAHPGPTLGVTAAALLTGILGGALRGGPLVILPALLAVLAVNTTLTLVRQHAPDTLPSARDCREDHDGDQHIQGTAR